MSDTNAQITRQLTNPRPSLAEVEHWLETTALHRPPTIVGSTGCSRLGVSMYQIGGLRLQAVTGFRHCGQLR